MRITHEQIDAIVDSFAKLELDENAPSLPLNVESLQKLFNAQIDPLLDAETLGEEGLALLRKLLLIDEYQIYADETTGSEFFFNLFGDTIGLFGLGKTGNNLKIMRLCFVLPENQREAQTLNLVFHAFTKVFLPEADDVEFITALKSNFSVRRSGLIFSMMQEGNLLTVTARAE